MNGSNKDATNSIHRVPLRDTYLLIAGLLGGFGLFIVLALGIFSGAQATTRHTTSGSGADRTFWSDVPSAAVRSAEQCGSRRSYAAG